MARGKVLAAPAADLAGPVARDPARTPTDNASSMAACETFLAPEVVSTTPSRQEHVTLSVIVPAYRDHDRIGPNLNRLSNALDTTGLSWEVIVVVDGDPETYRHASALDRERVTVLGYQTNKGKGFAVRYGMMQARGELVTLLDSDMDIAPEEIGRMVQLLRLYGADVVVGSKRHPLSKVRYPLFRRIQSASYQQLVRLMFRVKVRDTQTGLKLMRSEVARRVLDVAVVKRFAFDVELLAVAKRFGFGRIIEAPVEIDYQFSTTANPFAVFRVLWDTLAIFYRLRIRHWYDKPQARGLDAITAGLPSPMALEAVANAPSAAQLQFNNVHASGLVAPTVVPAPLTMATHRGELDRD